MSVGECRPTAARRLALEDKDGSDLLATALQLMGVVEQLADPESYLLILIGLSQALHLTDEDARAVLPSDVEQRRTAPRSLREVARTVQICGE